MNLIRHNFPNNQFVSEKSVKRQIVLHHTASGPGVNGDINWWMKTPERVATHFIIDRDGVVHQLFDEEYWGYHLGLSQRHFNVAKLPWQNLDKQSIGIELDSWGPVLPHTDGRFYPVKWNGSRYIPNTACKPVKYFYEYCERARWKGHLYYEKYTTAQLASLKELLKELCNRHHIISTYNNDMWVVSTKALKGDNGIFAHCSYRFDKSDVHPQPELVNILKSI